MRYENLDDQVDSQRQNEKQNYEYCCETPRKVRYVRVNHFTNEFVDEWGVFVWLLHNGDHEISLVGTALWGWNVLWYTPSYNTEVYF